MSLQAEASEYLGEFCWQINQSDNRTAVIKVGLFHLGGGHGSISGKVIAGTGGEVNVHGNAEILGDNKVHLTLVDSFFTGNGTGGEIVNIVLDDSLNGSYTTMQLWVDTTGSDNRIKPYTGTMTFISCP